MKKLLFSYFIFLFITPLFSQNSTLFLKSGEFLLINDIVSDNDLNYHFMHFSEIPSYQNKEKIKTLGINFLEYIPNKSYVVSIPKVCDISSLSDFGVISITSVKPEHKIDPKIQNNKFPSWAINNNWLSVKLLLYKNADIFSVEELIRINNYQIDDINISSNYITVTVDPNELSVLSSINEIWYIEPIDAPGFPENKTARTLHRSNTINTNYATGMHYNGEGVSVVMQDDGYVQPHIDRKGRIDESFCNGCSTSSGNDHGDHCSGTIMGAGNLDPTAKGMADGAFLYTMGYSTGNYTNSSAFPLLHTNYDVVVTSTSYSNGCNAGYTSLASDIDEQAALYTTLIHVFSAGNDGGSDCGYGAGTGWGNVTGGHKQGKNVIAVANLDYVGDIASSSSRGPAEDGRIKPDIGAKGSSVYSTEHNNTYGTKTGTSMSCPGVAGIMAQLYQAYKEINSVTLSPPSALMKCLILNSADDRGNPGPDFKHGWGEVNAYRAVKIMENGTHTNGSISQSFTNNHVINVPANVGLIKVMVYWHDKEGSANASTALVNDINIQLSTPSGTSYNPWVLDPTPNSSILDQDAVRGIDNLNNMEQVTIDNPSLGAYTLSVEGFAVPFGPQEYYVTYEFIMNNEITLTYPVGGESWVPGDGEVIRWDTYGNNGNFTLEYTNNGGVNWQLISSSVSGNSRHYVLNPGPSSTTDNAKVRISRNGILDESEAPFTNIGVPSNLSVYWACPDSINVSWNAVSNATSYEVSMLGQKYMDSIFTTTSTNIWVANPNPNVVSSWFSVKAKINNGKGRRAIAVESQQINNQCEGYGCTDINAYNYSALAFVNDGSCCYISGCTNFTSVNYDSTACFDNGSCIAPIVGCTNPSAINFDPSANTTIAFGGALDNTIGGGGYFNGDQQLNFDASKVCVIKSAVIYSEASNTITFELRNNTGAVIDDTTLNVVFGQQRIPLNFDVPIGIDMQLGVSSGALQNTGLYRNNSGPSYPYDIASAINITSSSAGSAPLGYYYFFYDIEVEIPCIGSITPSWDCIQGSCVDPGTGQGNYASLLACQANCILVAPSWNCVQGNCIDPGNGQGTYTSLSSCQSNCVIAQSWDCDGQGNCLDPGTGNGMYTNLSACETNCIVPSWDCDGQGNCLDPGTGNGIYTNLSACEINCIVPSWDCDGQGNCIDPGTGQGLYSNLNDCELECINVSIDVFDLLAFKIYPNPSENIFNITFTSQTIQDLRVRVLNIIGKETIIEDLQQFVGEYVKTINLDKYSKGIYFLEIETKNGIINKKLILQ